MTIDTDDNVSEIGNTYPTTMVHNTHVQMQSNNVIKPLLHYELFIIIHVHNYDACSSVSKEVIAQLQGAAIITWSCFLYR